MLGTSLVSRTKQALINICKAGCTSHFLRVLWPSPGACHVATLPLHHSSVTFLLSSLGSASLLGRESNWKTPTAKASFQQTLAATGLCSRRLCCESAAWVAHEPFFLPYLGLPCSPLSSQRFILDAHRRALQTFPEESEATNLFPFCFSAPLPRPLLPPQPLLPADREICRAESAYTWPRILLITMRAAGN